MCSETSNYDLLMTVRAGLPLSSTQPKVHAAFDALNELLDRASSSSSAGRSPDQPSGGTLSEDLLAIASGLEIGREQAAQALAAHVANIREIASRLHSHPGEQPARTASSTEMGEAVKDIANLLTGWAWERPQRDETEIARVIVERLRSSSITAADPAASSSGADADAPDDDDVDADVDADDSLDAIAIHGREGLSADMLTALGNAAEKLRSFSRSRSVQAPAAATPAAPCSDGCGRPAATTRIGVAGKVFDLCEAHAASWDHISAMHAPPAASEGPIFGPKRGEIWTDGATDSPAPSTPAPETEQ